MCSLTKSIENIETEICSQFEEHVKRVCFLENGLVISKYDFLCRDHINDNA